MADRPVNTRQDKGSASQRGRELRSPNCARYQRIVSLPTKAGPSFCSKNGPAVGTDQIELEVLEVIIVAQVRVGRIQSCHLGGL
ncbi:MAG: hypothetical protein ACI841_000058 [Planctomycetota bacterium]|jgi:hypothetical protein